MSFTFQGDELVGGYAYVPRASLRPIERSQCSHFGDELGVSLYPYPSREVGTIEASECRSCEGGAVLFEPLPAPSERCGVDAVGRLSLPGPGVTPVQITAVIREGGVPPNPPDPTQPDGSIDAASSGRDSSTDRL